MAFKKLFFCLFSALTVGVLTLHFNQSSGQDCCCGAKTTKFNLIVNNSCCSDDLEKSSSEQCAGKCSKNNCQIQNYVFAAVLNESSLKDYYIDLNCKKSQHFFDKNSRISSGFYVIWSPPNIV